MKRILIMLAVVIGTISANAQVNTDVVQSINKIKRDTTFIYAEATMKDLNESFNGACAILEMKVGDWVRSQHPNEDIEVCVVKAKQHFFQLETRRGEFYRAFVYVHKGDVMPVADKREIAVFEVSPVTLSDQLTSTPSVIIEEKSIAAPQVLLIELTSEEKRMAGIKNFDEVEPYIKDLKNKGNLKRYGKYATIPESEDCYLFVYDKQGNIPALLRKSASIQYNLITLKEDNVKNYKNCGAIWFQLK